MPAEYRKLLDAKLEQLRQNETREIQRIEEANQVNVYAPESGPAPSGLSKRVEEMLREARQKIRTGHE